MKIENTRTNTSQVEDKQLARESHVDPTIHSKVTDKKVSKKYTFSQNI